MKRRAFEERRGEDRPVNGSTRPCAACSRGTLEFNERYRLPGTGGHVIAIPAWVCDTCGHKRPARAEDQAQRLRAAAKAVRAQGTRQLLKARAARPRADRSLQSSARRRKTRG